ncbi:MAG: helix-turn-helix transcriptional regulator [Leptolyngbyaceae cyanobacterium SM2_5_2]|nr:helix-turn-helix transcriptional regulator [Leptolyngbyaceae cyanobacterium SM2_5_2]
MLPEIDYTQDDQILQVYPCLPLLSSQGAAWQGLHLGYYRQPAHETPEHAAKQYIIGIDLGPASGAVTVPTAQQHSEVSACGMSCIHPASSAFKERWPEAIEFIDLYLEPTFLTCVASEFVDLDCVEVIPHHCIYDPFLGQIGLLLKSELERGKAGTSLIDSQLYVESMATTLVMHLLKHYSTAKQPVQNIQAGLSPSSLRRVIAYIHEHLASDLSLTEVANVVPLSTHYFATLFKQSTGETVLQYITRCRIERAKQLLAKRALAIADICQQVGFHDQSYFTKVFQRYNQMTPRAYRSKL